MPKILNIPVEELRQLYLNQRLSSRKIAKIYSCAYSTIDNKIHRAGLPTRNRAQAHVIYPRKDFDGDKEEKAYLIGFRIGDLRVRKPYPNSETIHIDCGSTKVEQITLIKNLFLPYGRVWISKPNSRSVIQIECSVNHTFEFLLTSKLESWIMKTRKYFFSFLAGFTDAEGSIFISKNQAIYSLGNYNLYLLNQIKYGLEKFGLKTTQIFLSPRKGLIASHGYRYNHDYRTLRVGRKIDLFKLLFFIGPYLKHSNRIRQMKIAIKNIEERNKLYGIK